MAEKPSEWPATVTTTIEPDRQIEVGEAEWTDLSRQGLLVDDSVDTPRPRSARSARAETQIETQE